MVFRKAWLVLAAAMCAACGQIPDGVQPVTGFDAERYLGTWYEVARLDHSFERGTMQEERILPLSDCQAGPGAYFAMVLIPGQGRQI